MHNGGSAFNIKSESIRLQDFTPADVAALLQQHTAATGQTCAPGVLQEIWLDTQDQPWQANALAYEACFRKPEQRDPSQPVTVEQMRQARESLILRRDTHMDQLANKLRELTSIVQDSLQGHAEQPWFVMSGGAIDMVKLLAAFQQFFRENSKAWLELYAYKEVGPHLLL